MISKGLSLKIGGQWAVLKEGSELSMESHSPVLNEQGTFSYPFTLPYQENRHLFGNVGDADGQAHLYDIDGKDFQLYLQGMLICSGLIDTDDEEEVSTTIPINLVSGNAVLKKLIEGVKASDIPVKDKIRLGYTIGKVSLKLYIEGTYKPVSYDLDRQSFMNYENVNVSEAYPSKAYCNVRLCYKPSDTDTLTVLEAKRPWSGVCFYLAYFLDCLWNHLGLHVTENELLNYEDFKRLAFFTTKCEAETQSNSFTTSDLDLVKSFVPDLTLVSGTKDLLFSGCEDIYASGKNFPDTSVESILNSIKSAFGAKVDISSTGNGVNIYVLKNVFCDNEVLSLDCDLLSVVPKHYKKKGVIVKYSSASDDNTSYKYTDWKNALLFSDYSVPLSRISSYDMTLYVNQITGKLFRVKVNKDAAKESEWYPMLFEVGQFNQVKVGDAPDDDCQEMSIDFTPVVSNDLNFKQEVNGVKQQVLAVAVESEMKKPKKETLKTWIYLPRGSVEATMLSWTKKENYADTSTGVSPLRSLDSGFALGIMRGPGNNAGLEFYNPNYDGNGNDAWTVVPSDYAFDEDCVTNWNQQYDYNGSEQGVPYLDQMFSLKLRAGKSDFPISSQYSKRGLVDTFLSEYVYFLSHYRPVIITARMELSQLLSIKWNKKYNIGGQIGYINKISYTVSDSGISKVKIELYKI